MPRRPELQPLPALRALPSRWDLLAFPLLFSVLFLLAWGSRGMHVPYAVDAAPAISLQPQALPEYALRTTLRMAAALLCSFVFTCVFAKLAAASRRAEQVLIPLLDVLQSVPILGFLSVTVVWFIKLFPGNLLGAECAAIFAIFTSQAWNMAFSFFYSLRMVPKDLYQVADLFGLSPWQRFCKLELPFAAPNLVWNAMMSVSGGWFFVVASEAITVGGHSVLLPGVGSYIAVAIQREDLHAIGWAIVCMALLIALYDQLVFRPLVAWADKFRFEFSQAQPTPASWMLTLLTRARWLRALLAVPLLALATGGHWLAQRLPRRRWRPVPRIKWRRVAPLGDWSGLLFNLGVALAAVVVTVLLARFVLREASYAEIARVFGLGACTLLRVLVLSLLATLLWVPLGILIGLHPRLAARSQPLALFLSAFPANLLFPVAVLGIVHFRLNPEIWVSPLMILGTQWYILFNVVAGASALPNDLREAAANLGLRGWPLWRRVLLPAVFPAYLTGGLTASGGAWNASVVSEVVSWGPTTLTATGVGAYIAQQTAVGDTPRVVLGIAVMSLYVVVCNRFLWKRLYGWAQNRLALD
ncbi:ABC transporter permease [Plasticicumulans acidivorans]|uniref:NitT/TauT family transport system permease protein n=1 Tax=Plasticicumulans acidivorans TaxID=886464 RepID=A0A317MT20_9GAMM|nr:ABC transporter permease subunit [Plasticicumulans acidivorans]PWV59893.1 NitT/TauT family transport system permease protein [Plasticicumulans acidivorans]